MDFIWECMVISFKSGLGLFFWMIALAIVGFVGSVISYMFVQQSEKKRPKYEGQPIVVKGGKEDD